mgnify:CR=1 FL=1
MVRACYKRPVATADIQKVVDRIETKVFSMEEKEIPSSAIGEAVMDELKRWMRLHMSVLHPFTENLRMSVHLWTN